MIKNREMFSKITLFMEENGFCFDKEQRMSFFERIIFYKPLTNIVLLFEIADQGSICFVIDCGDEHYNSFMIHPYEYELTFNFFLEFYSSFISISRMFSHLEISDLICKIKKENDIVIGICVERVTKQEFQVIFDKSFDDNYIISDKILFAFGA